MLAPTPTASACSASALERWRERLYASLARRPLPLVHLDGVVMPAASLWTGSRVWVRAFRDAGLRQGQRLVLALPPSPGFVQALVAAWWEGLTVAPAPPEADVAALAAHLDACVTVGSVARRDAGHWTTDAAGLPEVSAAPVRPTTQAATPDARLLLRTSGTTGEPRWIALSDANLGAVLDSHRAAWPEAGARMVSVLPWHHAFGLVLDLLPALLAGAEIHRDAAAVRDPQRLTELLEEAGASHLSAVPLTVRRVGATPRGRAALQRLVGGVVGGAALDAEDADLLAGTRMRVGYGQTEAAPGICLGEPGDVRPGYLGRPVGCITRVETDGVLAFSGPNASIGTWAQDGLRRHAPDRWVRTGDLVRAAQDGYTFLGRADARFKLANGRFVVGTTVADQLRTRLSGVEDVLVYDAGGAIGVVLGSEEGDGPSPEEVAQALGPLRIHLGSVRTLTTASWVRTPKGDVHRPATLRAAGLPS